jgi:hypothetical protein
MDEVLRPRDFGELFSQMMSVTIGNIRKLLAIQLVFWIPVYVFICVITFLLISTMGYSEGGSAVEALVTIFVVLGIALLVLLLSPLPAAASILAVADRFVGQETSIRDCYAAAFRRLLPLIGLMLALGLIQGLAFIACIIPYFILAPRLFIATQCLVLEELGVGAAIDRSWRLTQGHFWKILGLLVVIIIFGMILNQIAKVPQNLLLETFESIPVAMIISFGISILLSMLSAILTAVGAVVVYFDLRTRKEALDMEGLLNLVDEIGPGYQKEGEPT